MDDELLCIESFPMQLPTTIDVDYRYTTTFTPAAIPWTGDVRKERTSSHVSLLFTHPHLDGEPHSVRLLVLSKDHPASSFGLHIWQATYTSRVETYKLNSNSWCKNTASGSNEWNHKCRTTNSYPMTLPPQSLSTCKGSLKDICTMAESYL